MRNVVSWKPLVLGASFLLYGAGTAFATETDHLYPTPSTGFMSVQQDGRQINCHIVDKSGSYRWSQRSRKRNYYRKYF